jgi:predicted dehydrogenase
MRYGIIGSGRMGIHHAKQLMEISDAEIIAVSDVDEEKARNLAEQTGASYYTDYIEMLDKERLDAVYLCTPVRGRLEQVKEITSRKLHLYIEKPLAVSIEEGQKIVDLVEQSGIICTVGFQWRYMDIVQQAKALIREEPISLITGRYYWTIPIITWIRDRKQGGGQVFDQNIHMIDLAIYFSGKVDHVFSAYTQKVTHGEMENWDGYSTTMKFDNETVGNFYSTYALYPEIREEPFLDVIQKNRLLRITAGKLVVKTPGKEEIFYSKDKMSRINVAFHEAIRENNSTGILAPIQDALYTLRVVLASNYSAIYEKVVKVDQLKSFGLDDIR